MRNTYLLIIFLVIAVLFFGWLTFSFSNREPSIDLPELTVGDTTLMVELADTSEKISRGLSGREKLDKDQGMLFIFPNSTRRQFWMKEMNFPLDMVFINDDRVVEVILKIPAPQAGEDGRKIQVMSSASAEMVLEVNSGWVARNRVIVGDRVILETK